jgi:hypothetical protein
MRGAREKALAEARRIRSPHVTYGLVCRAIAFVPRGRREEASASIVCMLSINPHCGSGVLAELGAHLAAEIETALTEAGLAGASPDRIRFPDFRADRGVNARVWPGGNWRVKNDIAGFPR